APDSAAPSAMAYRGSLLALGLASIVAIFLFVRPPESESTVDEPRPVVTNTPAFQATATPTSEGNPGGAPTEAGRPTTTIATPTATPPPTAEPTPPGTSYTVQPGETLT